MGSNIPKTHEKYVEEMFNKYGDDFTVLGTYTKGKDKILVRHNICETEWSPFAQGVLSKGGCPTCGKEVSRIKRVKSQVEFEKDIYDLVGEEYSVAGDYINSSENVVMRHNTCNHEWSIKAGHFLYDNIRCPKCDSLKKREQQYIQEVYEIYGEEYSITGQYVGSIKPILIKHNICGKEFEIRSANSIKKKNFHCKECYVRPVKNNIKPVKKKKEIKKEVCDLIENKYNITKNVNNNKKNIKRNTEIFKQEVFDLVGDEYTVIGEYINTDTHIIMRHNCEKCNNHEYPVTPNKFLSDRRCPHNICKGERVWKDRKKTHEQFEKEVYELTENKFLVLGEYIDTQTKVLMKHNIPECNYEWETIPSIFLNEKTLFKCPQCAIHHNSGETHYNWQGGLSGLVPYFRRTVPVIWKKESMKNCGYKCVITGERFDAIHHLYGFSSFVKDTLDELGLSYSFGFKAKDFTSEQLKSIGKLLWIKHEKLMGVCLTRDIHELFHTFYLSKNNTPQQFTEFIQRLEDHEFDEYLKKRNLTLNINHNVLDVLLREPIQVELSQIDSSFLINNHD